jgi:hypothetical protein
MSQRTDPWRWYCRLCGARGEAATEPVRNAAAAEHLRTTECGRHHQPGRAIAGRLLHVWTFRGPSPYQQWIRKYEAQLGEPAQGGSDRGSEGGS